MSDQRNELLKWAKGEEETEKGRGENEAKVVIIIITPIKLLTKIWTDNRM